ncbi:MAG: carboxypeptidase-like regulatory domain-containing protein [Gemmatimonadota bacterium]
MTKGKGVGVPGRTLILLLLTAAAAACGSDGQEPIFCTQEYRAGINVEIRDAATLLPAAEGAVLTVKDGDYQEVETSTFDGLTMSAAWERAGVYDVTVTKTGYRPWFKSGVEVTADECHVQSVQLQALLERDAGG